MSTEKKRGWLWQPSVEIKIMGETVRIHGFMPLPASLCILPAYDRESKMFLFERITAEMVDYFLKQCVIDPVIDDEFLQNSDGTFKMRLLKEIIERVQPSEEQLKEIKKTSPIKP